MKKLLSLLVAAAILSFISCSGEKISSSGKPQIISSATPVKDSIEYYETDIVAKQKSYKAELEGRWNVTTMHRQQKAEPETLQNVFIQFGTDTSFTGKAPCNRMGGIYTLKGTSIRFSGIYSTKMACANMEPESAFFQLLEQRISAYAVDANKLQLKDVAGNVVFECERAQ